MKQHWLKVDFSRWKDEDDSEDEGEGQNQDLEEVSTIVHHLHLYQKYCKVVNLRKKHQRKTHSSKAIGESEMIRNVRKGKIDAMGIRR